MSFTDKMTTDVLRDWTEAPCCVDGWVMGHGIERCDECNRFECDEDAANHIIHVINTLEANGYLTSVSASYVRSAIDAELHPDDEEEDEDE